MNLNDKVIGRLLHDLAGACNNLGLMLEEECEQNPPLALLYDTMRDKIELFRFLFSNSQQSWDWVQKKLTSVVQNVVVQGVPTEEMMQLMVVLHLIIAKHRGASITIEGNMIYISPYESFMCLFNAVDMDAIPHKDVWAFYLKELVNRKNYRLFQKDDKIVIAL